MQDLNEIQRIAVWALPVLFAVTLHEVAHGWSAKLLGDSTAEDQGRLSLNPLKHIDPFGTVILPLVLLWLGGFVFGWAKPVPVVWGNLRRPQRDMAIVALAGPGANFLMIVLWALLFKISLLLDQASMGWLSQPLLYMSAAGMQINTILMVLNLLPIPPLDGSRVISLLLPRHWVIQFFRIEAFGMVILIVLLFTGILGKIIVPINAVVINGFRSLFGF